MISLPKLHLSRTTRFPPTMFLLFMTPLADKELTIWGYMEEKTKAKETSL